MRGSTGTVEYNPVGNYAYTGNRFDAGIKLKWCLSIRSALIGTVSTEFSEWGDRRPNIATLNPRWRLLARILSIRVRGVHRHLLYGHPSSGTCGIIDSHRVGGYRDNLAVGAEIVT